MAARVFFRLTEMTLGRAVEHNNMRPVGQMRTPLMWTALDELEVLTRVRSGFL